MSRSGYYDDIENWELIKWRGQVASAIRGKRGQAFLRELVEALDAMTQKRLIANELKCSDGVCALGSIGVKRGVELEKLDPEDYDTLADTFGIAHQLVQEIEYLNDEMYGGITPEVRWEKVRAWALSQIKP